MRSKIIYVTLSPCNYKGFEIMNRFDRAYRLHALLSNRRTPLSLKSIMEQLECSKSTADRDIENLRDNLQAPLEYSRDLNGYFYNQSSSKTPYELPGLWFSTEELHGLLICQQLLQNISPGILSLQIKSLQKRINNMLSKAHSPLPIVSDKIQFTSVGKRLQDDSQFKRIATALFCNQQVHIDYQPRGKDSQTSKRTLSPQKIIYHRDNWYLVAHCHNKNQLRLFSVDRINSAKSLEETAIKIADKKLQDFLNSSYGIFTGKATHMAILEFTKDRASWIADELWHSEQQGEWLKNGNFQLSIPFSDSRELVMDILKHGAEVKVTAPPFLQQIIKAQIKKMQGIYKK